LPGPSRLLGLLGKDEEVVIPWEKIVKIGVDVILVEVPGYGDARYFSRR
jgi:sporulation protein YlmC with PRC-barrel domain